MTTDAIDTEEPNGPTLIHKSLTRAINVVAISSVRFRELGFDNSKEQEGFVAYAHCLHSALLAHYRVEGSGNYPAVGEAHSDAMFALIREHHRRMLPYVETFCAAVDSLERVEEDQTSTDLAAIHSSISAIKGLWEPHIALEERWFQSKGFGESLDEAELRSVELVAEEQQKARTERAPPVIPFLLHNLEPADREELTGELPAIAQKDRVPLSWRERWKVMKPFLLD